MTRVTLTFNPDNYCENDALALWNHVRASWPIRLSNREFLKLQAGNDRLEIYLVREER